MAKTRAILREPINGGGKKTTGGYKETAYSRTNNKTGKTTSGKLTPITKDEFVGGAVKGVASSGAGKAKKTITRANTASGKPIGANATRLNAAKKYY